MTSSGYELYERTTDMNIGQPWK